MPASFYPRSPQITLKVASLLAKCPQHRYKFSQLSTPPGLEPGLDN